MQAVGNPYPIFLGLDGLALELGYIYIGTENLDPETNPKTVYYDEAGTQTASQPIRTLGGYPDRSGSPAQLYTSGKYSIRVRNAAGVQVFYLASAGTTEGVNSGDPYYVHVQFLGDAPSVSQVVAKHVFPTDVSFPADMASAVWFDVGTNPGSNAIFDMRKNNVSFGTLTIDTSGDTTVDCTAASFAAGDVLTLVAPASSTIVADIAGTLAGTVS